MRRLARASTTVQWELASEHLAGAYFEQVAHVKLTHVPYRNIAQYGPDLIAGQVPLGFQWLPNVQGLIENGGARALAVGSKMRLAALPNIPTASEAGLPIRPHPAGLPCSRRTERRSRS